MPVGNVTASPILRTARTLTAAEVLTLFTAPVTIIPAPGIGQMIVLDLATFSLTYGGVAYATNTNLGLNYGAGTFATAAAATGTLLTATVDSVVMDSWSVNWEQVPSAQAIFANRAIVAQVAVGNPTAGNSPVHIEVFYYVVPLT